MAIVEGDDVRRAGVAQEFFVKRRDSPRGDNMNRQIVIPESQEFFEDRATHTFEETNVYAPCALLIPNDQSAGHGLGQSTFLAARAGEAAMLLVRGDDALDKRMADDIATRELHDGNAFNVLQCPMCFQ